MFQFLKIKKNEKRIAITPEITKKYIASGLEVNLPQNYGVHLGFSDQDFKDQGAQILDDEQELLKDANFIVQLGLPVEKKLTDLKENQNLIGILNPYTNEEKLNSLAKKKN